MIDSLFRCQAADQCAVRALQHQQHAGRLCCANRCPARIAAQLLSGAYFASPVVGYAGVGSECGVSVAGWPFNAALLVSCHLLQPCARNPATPSSRPRVHRWHTIAQLLRTKWGTRSVMALLGDSLCTVRLAGMLHDSYGNTCPQSCVLAAELPVLHCVRVCVCVCVFVCAGASSWQLQPGYCVVL
jgi:hypothetical protein